MTSWGGAGLEGVTEGDELIVTPDRYDRRGRTVTKVVAKTGRTWVHTTDYCRYAISDGHDGSGFGSSFAETRAGHEARLAREALEERLRKLHVHCHDAGLSDGQLTAILEVVEGRRQ